MNARYLWLLLLFSLLPVGTAHASDCLPPHMIYKINWAFATISRTTADSLTGIAIRPTKDGRDKLVLLAWRERLTRKLLRNELMSDSFSEVLIEEAAPVTQPLSNASTNGSKKPLVVGSGAAIANKRTGPYGTLGWNYAYTPGTDDTETEMRLVTSWHIVGGMDQPIHSRFHGGAPLFGDVHWGPRPFLVETHEISIGRHRTASTAGHFHLSCADDWTYPTSVAAKVNPEGTFRMVGAKSNCVEGKLVEVGIYAVLLPRKFFSLPVFAHQLGIKFNGSKVPDNGDSGSMVFEADGESSKFVGIQMGYSRRRNGRIAIVNPAMCETWKQAGTFVVKGRRFGRFVKDPSSRPTGRRQHVNTSLLLDEVIRPKAKVVETYGPWAEVEKESGTEFIHTTTGKTMTLN